MCVCVCVCVRVCGRGAHHPLTHSAVELVILSLFRARARTHSEKFEIAVLWSKLAMQTAEAKKGAAKYG